MANLVTEEHKDRMEMLVPQDLRVSKAQTDSVVSPEKWDLLDLKAPQDNLELPVPPGLLVPQEAVVPLDLREGKEKMEKREHQDSLSVLMSCDWLRTCGDMVHGCWCRVMMAHKDPMERMEDSLVRENLEMWDTKAQLEHQAHLYVTSYHVSACTCKCVCICHHMCHHMCHHYTYTGSTRKHWSEGNDWSSGS